MTKLQKIVPCLWFDSNAKEAANFYVSMLTGSQIGRVLRYGEGNTEGMVKYAQLSLNGNRFVAMDGGEGHAFTFNEALSLQIICETQAEIDHYRERLMADGGEEGPCGWLKDKFGVSWQVSPTVLIEMMSDPDPVKAQRATKAMLQMKKFDIAALKRAYEG